MSATFGFSGESVLVTGASRGIGYAVACAFALAGAELTVLADDAAVTTAAHEIERESGRTVVPIQCDIADAAVVARALQDVERIDVLVNNAGVELATPVTASGSEVDDAFERIIDVNVRGTWRMTRAALPKMDAGGRILMTSSIWGHTAVPEFAGYVGSKHALVGIVRSLARELGSRGIRVNAVCPGWVRTEAAMRSLAVMAKEKGTSEETMLADIVAAQSLEGLMTPVDVAGSYLYLASDAAANVTGQTLVVDRGEITL